VFSVSFRLVTVHPASCDNSPRRSDKLRFASSGVMHSVFGVTEGVSKPGIIRLCVYSHSPGSTVMMRSAAAELAQKTKEAVRKLRLKRFIVTSSIPRMQSDTNPIAGKLGIFWAGI
jgi:hypothetical protein